jgi:hypothetical protein
LIGDATEIRVAERLFSRETAGQFDRVPRPSTRRANARRISQRTGAIAALISQRFSTVRMADPIVVLAGHLVEFGSHDELMAPGGHDVELFTLQARAYR